MFLWGFKTSRSLVDKWFTNLSHSGNKRVLFIKMALFVLLCFRLRISRVERSVGTQWKKKCWSLRNHDMITTRDFIHSRGMILGALFHRDGRIQTLSRNDKLLFWIKNCQNKFFSSTTFSKRSVCWKRLQNGICNTDLKQKFYLTL